MDKALEFLCNKENALNLYAAGESIFYEPVGYNNYWSALSADYVNLQSAQII
jgi:hypothetical protein